MKEKRFFGVLLALVLCVWALPVETHAESYGDLKYSVENGKVTITDCSVYATSVDIPAEIDGYPVTAIGVEAFRECSRLTNIAIPVGLTSVGKAAFRDCTSLTSITFPNSVTSIGSNAFYNCKKLTSVTLPTGITSIEDCVFIDCVKLTDIVIPEGVTSIGAAAFSGCSSLPSITIPSSVTLIKNTAFQNCKSLISITIPNGVTSIEMAAFWNCTNLNNITLSNSLTFIGLRAFEQCSSLTAIALPDSLTSIGNCAFSNCTGLTSIAIPEGVTDTGNSTFENCTSLTTVTLPDGLASVGYGAFQNCTSLTSIVLPDSVTSIGGYAFSGCTGLTRATVSGNVTSVGDYAFDGCAGLTSITIPNCVTSIGVRAFQNCTALESVYFQGNLPSLDFNCFRNVIATVYYPEDEAAWTEEARQDYGGTLTWVAYDPHEWQNATCTAPDTCTACGKTRGEALGHTYHVTGATETDIVYSCIRCADSYTESKSAESPTITATGARGRVGETVEIELRLENNPGFLWLQFNVTFDTSKLELTDCENHGLFPDFMKQQLSDGSYNFIWEDAANAVNLTGDGLLATLSFKILDGAEAGDELPITISYDPGNIYDEDFSNVTFAPKAGAVSVAMLNVEFALTTDTETAVAVTFSNITDETMKATFVVAVYSAEGQLIGVEAVTDGLQPDGTVALEISVASDSRIATAKGFVLNVNMWESLFDAWIWQP